MSTSKSDRLAALLNRLPASPRYCVAYSGGIDSHVLLHALVAWAANRAAGVSAVHVDHRLHTDSGDWAVHCRDVCQELGVPLDVLTVDARPQPGESPEGAARRARYQALADWLPADALLLAAQHREDQAETLLLQLFRGAGPRGLAAMPFEAPFGAGRLVRPLLGLGRDAIAAYAREQGLRWIEDPSNTDTRYDRNLLRHQLLPQVRQRWPGIDAVLARSAALQADQAELADALAAQDLAGCADTERPYRLAVTPLRALDRARQRNLLRYWIAANQLPLPAAAHIEQILDSLLTAAADREPRVHWPGADVRRFHGQLYALRPLPPFDAHARFTWNLQQDCVLPALGTLYAIRTTGRGLRVPASDQLEVRFRQGGERLQPAGRRGHHALKKLLQEWRVPVWERERLPLLFSDDRLVAVAGHCVAEGYQAGEGDAGMLLRWQPLHASAG